MWRKAVPPLLILAMVLAGCGTRQEQARPALAPEPAAAQQPAPAREPAPAQEPAAGPPSYRDLPAATVRLTSWSPSPAATAILVEEVLKEFQAAYPNIAVRYEPVTDDYLPKFQDGTMPDIFYLDAFFAAEFLSRGFVLPLDELVQKYGVNTGDFHESALNGFKWQGKLYGLPTGYTTLGLFYNKEMFAAANITEPPGTWEELRETARKLTAGDRKGLVLPAADARFVPFIYAAGGKLSDPGLEQFYFDSPETVRAMEFYTGLIRTDKVAGTPAALGTGSGGDAFARGKAAMALENCWFITHLKQAAPDLQYGVAELPAGQARGNLVFTSGYAVNASSQVPEQAFALVDFLTSQATQEKMLAAGVELPSRKSASSTLAGDPLKAPLMAGAAYAVPFRYDVNMQETRKLFTRALAAIINEGADPRTRLAEVQQSWQSSR